jgi:transcriptional regulator CBF1
MAETAEVGLAAGLINSPGQKRKRGEQTSPGDRRSKRTAPAATMTSDPPSYIESAVEAAQAAAAASGVNVADFNALQQAAQGDQPEATDATTASSTAAAALGTMYPTLHVPQPTEETFAAQNVGDGDHTEDISLIKADNVHPHGLPADDSVASLSTPTNGIRAQDSRYQPPVTPTGSTQKPTVGSEEWHKMRKDNHKEGWSRWSSTLASRLLTRNKLSAGAARPSMRVSTSCPR